jgi:hypothetical protein
MAEPPRYSETGEEPDVSPDLELTDGTPRWVKVFGLIALVLVVVFVILLLTGRHGPSRHSFGGGGGDSRPSLAEGMPER